MLDIRGLAECSTPGRTDGEIGGRCIVEIPEGTALPKEFIPLAASLDEIIDNAAARNLGVSFGSTLRASIIERLIEGAPPDQSGLVGPPGINRKKQAVVGIGNFRVALDFSPSMPGWSSIRARMVADIESTGAKRDQVLFSTLEKLGYPATREAADELFSINREPVKPATRWADTFVEAGASYGNLTAHTPTGTDAGTSWTALTGTPRLDQTEDAAFGGVDAVGGDGTRISARMENSLSGTDATGQVDVRFSTSLALKYGGVSLRFASAANTFMTALIDCNPTDLIIQKCVAGTYTTLASGNFTPSTGTWYTVALECDGSDFDGLIDATSYVTVNDNSISTGLRGGINGAGVGSSSTAFDTFSYSDLAAVSTRGMPFGSRGTAFNGGRTFSGIIR